MHGHLVGRKMKDLYIVGAGGCGREVLQWCKDINKIDETWHICGFIDDNPGALDAYDCDYGIMGTISEWKPGENEVFALAIAGPETKRKVVRILEDKGAEFVSVIHPRALISDYTQIGKGVVIYPGARMSPNSSIGDYVTLLDTGIGHDAVVEDYAAVSAGCAIMRSVHIGKCAFIGANAVLLPGMKVGNSAYVGAGSVVVRNVHDGYKVFGNPAKKLEEV